MLFGLIGIVYALGLVFFLKDVKRSKVVATASPKHFFHGLFQLFRLWPFWLIVLYFMIPSLPGWAIKNWAPTLIADTLKMDMALAGPLTTISISMASLIGVVLGGYFSDRWFRKNIRGRIFTGLAGLVLTIPALLIMGNGGSAWSIIGAAMTFGFGFGVFDSNNMPILCQFVKQDQRATAYGFLNTAGICSGALITDYLGKSTDKGDLAGEFSKLAFIVLIVVIIQLLFLKPVENQNRT
jgi:sugar phosphate permease